MTNVTEVAYLQSVVNLGRSQKSNNLIFPADYAFTIFPVNFVWNWLTIVMGEAFWKSQFRIFATCTEWPQTEHKALNSTEPKHAVPRPQVTNSHPLRSTASWFQDIIPFFIISPYWLPMLTSQSATKCLKLAWLPRKLRGVAFWNFQPPYGAALRKNQSAIKF